MSEKPQPTPSQTAELEAIRTAPSFDALKQSLENAYAAPLPPLPDEHLDAQLEHHDVLRDAAASLHEEVRNLEDIEREDIDVELERCLVDLPHINENRIKVEGRYIYENLGNNVKNRVAKLLAKEAISNEQISIALAILEEITRSDEQATAWSVLTRVPRERLPEEAAMRILAMGANSRSVLVNERYPDYPSGDYGSFLKTMEHVIGERQGGPLHWMKDGKSTVDDRLKGVVENKHFLPYCINLAIHEANKEKTPDSRYFVQRSYESYILEDMLGLPEEMVAEFDVAFSARTRTRSHDGIIPLEKGGSIEQDTWKRQFGKYVANVQEIGAANAYHLRKEWGIVNFDRPSAEQLKRMLRLSAGDESLLEQARTHEVTFVLLDAIGDTKGAFDSDLYHAEEAATRTASGEPTGDLVLFGEINQPSDIYRHLVTLYQRHGIRPSNLFVGTHGLPEGMFFSADVQGFAPDDKDYRNEFRIGREDILQSAASRFFKKYMQPGKASGVRNVLLGVCSQMEHRDRKTYQQRVRELETDEDFKAYHGQQYRDAHEPVGETLARVAGPDAHTRVYGVDESFRLEPAHRAQGQADIMVPYTSTKAIGKKRLTVRSSRAKESGMQNDIHLQGFPFNKTEKKEKVS